MYPVCQFLLLISFHLLLFPSNHFDYLKKVDAIPNVSASDPMHISETEYAMFYLKDQGKPILWGPDRYLGRYIQKQTGADMVMWQGSCVVHEEFKAKGLRDLMSVYPDAAVLVHPESPEEVVNLATVVGSTSRLLKASMELPHKKYIVATDKGIFYKMQQMSPTKTFYPAPTAGEGATCRSCAHCPWMAMNQVDAVLQALDSSDNQIHLDPSVIKQARISLERMVNFTS